MIIHIMNADDDAPVLLMTDGNFSRAVVPPPPLPNVSQTPGNQSFSR